MDEALPSLSEGAVGSRFVSQNDIETAREKREEQWKAAYARLGQEPPPQQQVDDSYDGRSLAEKLAANRVAKQEEWEEKTKLANQFRALEEDEIMFLDSLREKQEAEELERKQRDGEELQGFKQAVAARATNASPPTTASNPSTAPAKKSTIQPKKELKKSLKGVIVKKRAVKPTAPSKSGSSTAKDTSVAAVTNAKRPLDSDPAPSKEEVPDTKKRKVSASTDS